MLEGLVIYDGQSTQFVQWYQYVVDEVYLWS